MLVKTVEFEIAELTSCCLNIISVHLMLDTRFDK